MITNLRILKKWMNDETILFLLDLLEKVLSTAKEKVNEEPLNSGPYRRRPTSPSQKAEEKPKEPEYTKEQSEIVTNIKK